MTRAKRKRAKRRERAAKRRQDLVEATRYADFYMRNWMRYEHADHGYGVHRDRHELRRAFRRWFLRSKSTRRWWSLYSRKPHQASTIPLRKPVRMAVTGVYA